MSIVSFSPVSVALATPRTIAVGQASHSELRGISSMATKALLRDLSRTYQAQTGVMVQIESVGGVDAAKRVQAGEEFDMVLLGSEAIARLMASGHVREGSRCDWVRSPVAVAVPAGAPHPSLHDEAALKAAVLASPTISYSTGPSGVYLEGLFARWGVAEQIKPRLVVPPPGTPVGALVARGQAALGFQQLSELMALPGIEVLGNLPADVAFITTFSAGVPTATLAGTGDDVHDLAREAAVQSFFAFLASPAHDELKRQHGMSGVA